MTNFVYKPNVDGLLKFCKPLDSPFMLDSFVYSNSIDPAILEEVWRLADKTDLPMDFVSDYYWIVTRYLASYSNQIAFQKWSDLALKENKSFLKAISLIKEADKAGDGITLQIRRGKQYATIDSPSFVERIKKYLLDELQPTMDKAANVTRANFDNERQSVYIPAIAQYFASVGVENKPTIAKIICYLLSLAKMPVNLTVEKDGRPQKIPVSHDDDRFVEGLAVKTVFYYL